MFILLFVAAAGLLIFRMPRSGGELMAEVSLDGAVIHRMALSENQEYAVPQHPQVRLEVRDGRCAFVHSDCPDQICVKTGYIGEEGRAAACLPNLVLLRIVSESPDPDAADTVTY